MRLVLNVTLPLTYSVACVASLYSHARAVLLGGFSRAQHCATLQSVGVAAFRMLLRAECGGPPVSYSLRGTHAVLCTGQCAT
jgi:hypothetical protein